MAEAFPEVDSVVPPGENSERGEPEGASEEDVSSLELDKYSYNDVKKCAAKDAVGKDETTKHSQRNTRSQDETMIARDPVAVDVTLHKVGGMIGFSITGIYSKKKSCKRGPSDEQHFVKTVVAGGPAAKDGCIEVGDKIIEINGIELYGLPQEKVVNLIKMLDPVVMKLIKKGAEACGVNEVILQPIVYSKYHQKEDNSKDIFGKKSLGKHLPLAFTIRKKLQPVTLLSTAKLEERFNCCQQQTDSPK